MGPHTIWQVPLQKEEIRTQEKHQPLHSPPCPEEWPCFKEASGGHRFANQGEKFQEWPILRTAWSWTSSLRNCEKISFRCWSPQVLIGKFWLVPKPAELTRPKPQSYLAASNAGEGRWEAHQIRVVRARFRCGSGDWRQRTYQKPTDWGGTLGRQPQVGSCQTHHISIDIVTNCKDWKIRKITFSQKKKIIIIIGFPDFLEKLEALAAWAPQPYSARGQGAGFSFWIPVVCLSAFPEQSFENNKWEERQAHSLKLQHLEMWGLKVFMVIYVLSLL